VDVIENDLLGCFFIQKISNATKLQKEFQKSNTFGGICNAQRAVRARIIQVIENRKNPSFLPGFLL